MNSGISETQVINAGASVWVAETGGALTDCVGLPGDAGVWIEVRCSDGAQDRTYLFDKRGTRLAPAQEPQT